MTRARRPGAAADPAQLLARETRLEPFRPDRFRLLLGYPAPYRVGMSSLGFLTLHREVSARPGWSVERVFLPPSAPRGAAARDSVSRGAVAAGTAAPAAGVPAPRRLTAWESGDDVLRFDALGVSVAHELELGALIRLLDGLGLAPLRRHRDPAGPPVVLGGPLTGINPRLLAPFADLVVVGEADAAIHRLCDALEPGRPDGPADLAERIASIPTPDESSPVAAPAAAAPVAAPAAAPPDESQPAPAAPATGSAGTVAANGSAGTVAANGSAGTVAANGSAGAVAANGSAGAVAANGSAGAAAAGPPDDPRAGFWFPHTGAPPPPPARLPLARLPARSAIWSPDAELPDMALVEVARSCRRACSFCASSRLVMGPCRTVDAEDILAAVPDAAPRVGLVGTAVSDHPALPRLLETLVGQGRGVGVSSVRADRLDADLLSLLVRGGLRTLTIGVDGASERLRRAVKKGVTEQDLVRAAELAAGAGPGRGARSGSGSSASASFGSGSGSGSGSGPGARSGSGTGIRRLKLYQLVGLPEETDADLDEFVALATRLSRTVPVTVTLTPFVPKPGTPLRDAPALPVAELSRRLKRVQHALRPVARVRPDSARWAWVEARLARGDEATAEAVLAAERAGGTFRDYARGLEP